MANSPGPSPHPELLRTAEIKWAVSHLCDCLFSPFHGKCSHRMSHQNTWKKPAYWPENGDSSWGTARADPICLNIAGTGKDLWQQPKHPPTWNNPKHSLEREKSAPHSILLSSHASSFEVRGPLSVRHTSQVKKYWNRTTEYWNSSPRSSEKTASAKDKLPQLACQESSPGVCCVIPLLDAVPGGKTIIVKRQFKEGRLIIGLVLIW